MDETPGSLFSPAELAQADAGEPKPAPLFADWNPPPTKFVCLTPEAKRILRKITTLCVDSGLPYSFAGQQSFWQRYLGLGRTQTGQYIRELKNGGWLRVERRGRRNAWYFPAPKAFELFGLKPIIEPGIEPIIEPTIEADVNPGIEPGRPIMNSETKEIINHGDDDALSLDELTDRFIAAGYSDRIAARDVRRNPQLAAVALAAYRKGHVAGDFAGPGILNGMLNSPGLYHLVQDAGGNWHDRRPQTAAMKAADVQAARKQRAADRQASLDRWRRLDARAQAPIIAHVCDKLDLTPGSSVCEVKCAEELERRLTPPSAETDPPTASPANPPAPPANG
ncbi:MAG: hypothetical protein L0Y71_26080 [Gemmataceae bacterium]|nr:hypothetical protein [Gemmataceae bacterium]